MYYKDSKIPPIKLSDEPCHVGGNHLGNNNALKKMNYTGDGNPFLLPNNYVSFLRAKREQVMEIIREFEGDDAI